MWGSLVSALLGALMLGGAAWWGTGVVRRYTETAPDSRWVRWRMHVVLGVLVGIGVMLVPVDPVLRATLAVAGLGLSMLATVDLAVHRLPDRLVGAVAAVVLAGLVTATFVGEGSWADLGRAAVAGLAVGTGFLLLCLLTPSGLGLGDAKLAAVLATLLGWFSWSAVLAGIVLAFVTGGLVAVVLLVARRAGRRTPIAFGPFLSLGAALAVAAATTAPV